MANSAQVLRPPPMMASTDHLRPTPSIHPLVAFLESQKRDPSMPPPSRLRSARPTAPPRPSYAPAAPTQASNTITLTWPAVAGVAAAFLALVVIGSFLYFA